MKPVNKVLLTVLYFSIYTFSFSAEKFSILTWNILGPNAPDLAQHFPNETSEDRMKRVAQVINSFNADIVCLQEVTSTLSDLKVKTALTKNLDDKYIRAVFCDKGKNGGCVVFYNKTKFQHAAHQGFPLNDPNKIAGGGAAACAVLAFKNNPAKIIIICSLHLARGNNRGTYDDFNPNLPISNEEKGKFQLTVLLKSLSNFLNPKNIILANTPCILAGDFNTFYEEIQNDTIPDLRRLGFNFQMLDHRLLTVSRFNNIKKQNEFASIDHMLFSSKTLADIGLLLNKNFQRFQDQVINTYNNFAIYYMPSIQTLFPSDHLPFCAEFQIIEQRQPHQQAQPKLNPQEKQKFDKQPNNDDLLKAEFYNLLRTISEADQLIFLEQLEQLEKFELSMLERIQLLKNFKIQPQPQPARAQPQPARAMNRQEIRSLINIIDVLKVLTKNQNAAQFGF